MEIFRWTSKTTAASLTRVAASVIAASAIGGGACWSASHYSQVTGDWKSNYGPVHVKFVAEEQPPGSASVVGNWLETPHHEGKIETGHYDAGTGELDLMFVETWTGHHGKVKLKLDKSGKSMTGIWKNDDGSSGTWTWTRR